VTIKSGVIKHQPSGMAGPRPWWAFTGRSVSPP
jgi:hypothetical protein